MALWRANLCNLFSGINRLESQHSPSTEIPRRLFWRGPDTEPSRYCWRGATTSKINVLKESTRQAGMSKLTQLMKNCCSSPESQNWTIYGSRLLICPCSTFSEWSHIVMEKISGERESPRSPSWTRPWSGWDCNTVNY